MSFTEYFFYKGRDIAPFRGYIHNSGSEEFADIEKAERFAQEALVAKHFDAAYFVGVLWRDVTAQGEGRTLDLFEFYEIGEWPGNATRRDWVYRNGLFLDTHRVGNTCREATVLVGRDQELCYRARSLGEYLEMEVDLSEVNELFEQQS